MRGRVVEEPGVEACPASLGPGVIAGYDYELRALEGLGLDDVEMDAALTFLLDFVQARDRSGGRTTRTRCGRPCRGRPSAARGRGTAFATPQAAADRTTGVVERHAAAHLLAVE